jgi:hydroxyacylglutathione hydrolase
MPASPNPNTVLCFTGGFTATNGYAVPTLHGWIAVDAPEGFADWLTSQHLNVVALLLTHAHFDHVVDAAKIVRTYGCPIYSWEKSTAESRLETYLWEAAGMKLSVTDYPVDFELAGKDRIDVAGIQFSLAHIPGHSPDSVAFIDPLHQMVFTGDTLMQGTMGRTDFPGGSTALLLRGMRRHLLSLPDSTQVFPGHGEPTTIGEERRWVEHY